MDEISLYNKINTFQAEMLDFNKKITPVKFPNQKEVLMLTYPEKNKLASSCISVLLAILKISVCITGPTIFPTIIYCIEGDSKLFWQITLVSSIITILLGLLIMSMLCMSIKKIQSKFISMLDKLNGLLNQIEFLKNICEVITSDFARKNAHTVLYPLVILFATSMVTLASYVKNFQVLFYASLMLICFVLGILSTIIHNLLNSPELPIHDPRKVQMEFIAPSPQSNYNLKSPSEINPIYQFFTPTISPLTNINYDMIETQSITAFLPDLSLQAHQKAIEKSNLQLPFNLSFFRK